MKLLNHAYLFSLHWFVGFARSNRVSIQTFWWELVSSNPNMTLVVDALKVIKYNKNVITVQWLASLQYTMECNSKSSCYFKLMTEARIKM